MPPILESDQYLPINLFPASLHFSSVPSLEWSFHAVCLSQTDLLHFFIYHCKQGCILGFFSGQLLSENFVRLKTVAQGLLLLRLRFVKVLCKTFPSESREQSPKGWPSCCCLVQSARWRVLTLWCPETGRLRGCRSSSRWYQHWALLLWRIFRLCKRRIWLIVNAKGWIASWDGHLREWRLAGPSMETVGKRRLNSNEETAKYMMRKIENKGD